MNHFKKNDVVVWYDYTPDGMIYKAGIVLYEVKPVVFEITLKGEKWVSEYSIENSNFAVFVQNSSKTSKFVNESILTKIGRL